MSNSTCSEVIQAPPEFLAGASALSLIGDSVIIGTFLLGGYEVRRAFTVRLIVYFSIADFIGNLPGLGSMPFTTDPPWPHLPQWICIMNGIGNWGTAQAGWFWTMAYVYVRRRAACPPPPAHSSGCPSARRLCAPASPRRLRRAARARRRSAPTSRGIT